MNILLLGGNGFIGHAVKNHLLVDGHHITAPTHRELDFIRPNISKLQALLHGQDVVINAVGIMHHRGDLLETIHHYAPLQFAGHAKATGVQYWLQLSALGADSNSDVAFVGSKGRGDDAIAQLATGGFKVGIARPSIVFGIKGIRTRTFLRIARLPHIWLPDYGEYLIQPTHIDDVAEGMCNMVQQREDGQIINMVGRTQHSFGEYLNLLRQNIHHKPPLHIHRAPTPALKMVLCGLRVPSKGFISADSMTLLRQGSCADVHPFQQLLGREPLGVADFYL